MLHFPSAMAGIFEALGSFAQRINDNERLGRLLSAWNRSILITPLDSDEQFTLAVEDGRVRAEPGKGSGEHAITVEGDSALLEGIFVGKENPAQAALDGGLVVYGTENDQIKLDAITLVLWGS